MFEKSTEIAQEVIAISQAKSCTEKEIWSMTLTEYYGNLKAFLKYIEERDKQNSKQKGI